MVMRRGINSLQQSIGLFQQEYGVLFMAVHGAPV